MNRTLVLLLAALGVTLGLLIWNDDAGRTAGLANEEFASVMVLSALLVSVLAGGLWLRGGLTGMLRNAALWLAIFAGLGFLYQASPALRALVAQ